MEILGIGPEELIFIVIIALILLGPRDMQKAGRTIGKWLSKVVTSDGWKIFQQTSREIQTLPNRLMREAQLDELKDIQKDIHQDLKQTANSIQQAAQPSQSLPANTPGSANPVGTENTILPSPPPPASPAKDKEQDA